MYRVKVSNESKRRGFTLVELLVVIAIIGMLVGLLLPAVQAAREAARRMQCSNNMKQVGLALHNYHSAFRKFPCYEILDLSAWRGHEYKSGWVSSLLPFFEEGNRLDDYDFDYTWFHEENQDVVARRLPMFECPSSPGGTQKIYTNSFNSEFTAVNPDVEAWSSDYAGNCGHRATLLLPEESRDKQRRKGFFVRAYPVQPQKFRDMLDGTSNTVAVWESAGRHSVYLFGKLWIDETTGQPIPVSPDNCAWASGNAFWLQSWSHDGIANGGSSVVNATNRNSQPYSFHEGGVHLLMVDGSVQYLTESVNNLTFIHMLTSQAREQVNLGEVF
ncbi:DUF1559 domain-containing protein [Stieleria sp. JC731]|uniref:DUF1559 domain-containing protein n=1 Tax=Pirellulaceae TaxID=2691357 RepID=UPI001E5B564C|nr:DUF1559 domain-containing protein [Stieleria sp. JC731]MCC9601303.1 DUF1559 domain-containing protein [Stieleria sp. JC731]